MEKYSTVSEDVNDFTKTASTHSCGGRKEVRGNIVYCENCGVIEQERNNKEKKL